MIEAQSLGSYRVLRHGFFTREGGVSSGAFASLNCGLSNGDSAEHVAANRARVAERLGIAPSHLVTAKQVHGTGVAEVTGPWAGAVPELDALVTSTPGIALGILTADCAPVLLADLAAGVIGAAHAGWRGALAGIIEATLAAMTRLGAQAPRIRAAVGPSIAQASYEIGPKFLAEFVERDPASASFFTPSPAEGRFRFNLPEYTGALLLRAGVTRIEVIDHDTLSNPARFFSHRRSTLAGEAECGRQLSAIVLGAAGRSA